MSIIETIKYSFNQLAPREKDIGAFIIKNPKETQSLTIIELAEKTETSPGSVTRFCKKIGCENFTQLKLNLASEETSTEQHTAKDMENSISTISFYYQQSIKNNLKSIDLELVKQITEDISKHPKIHIFGIGSSGLTALEFSSRLRRMGKVCFAHTDSNAMRIASTLMDKDDLIIAISNSGNNQEIIKSVQISKEKQAKIIAITSFQESFLTDIADSYILAHNAFFIDKHFVNTQYSIMFLIDVLTLELLKNPVFDEKMSTTVEAMNNYLIE